MKLYWLVHIHFLKGNVCQLKRWWETVWDLETGVHCHYSCCCCLFAKLYLTLCDPMDCSPPDSSVHGISQARILERVAIFFSRGSSWHGDQSCVSCIGFFFNHWATWNIPLLLLLGSYPRATSLDQGRQRRPDLLKTFKERTFSSLKDYWNNACHFSPVYIILLPYWYAQHLEIR